MKKKLFLMRPVTGLLAGVLAIFLAGCASEKNQPLSQRGWIGGEYAVAKPPGFMMRMGSSPGVTGTLPKAVQKIQKAAIVITELNTNVPAQLAGLRQGDFVLELNRQPVTRLGDFRRRIDRSQPGATLVITAWRDGHTLEYAVPVGREKFKPGGYFSITLPTVVHRWDLWPNPGFSLVILGYEPNPGLRRELGKNHEVYDEGWSAYLAFMEVSSGKRVSSQELVPAGGGN